MADLFKKIATSAKETLSALTRDKVVADWLTDFGEAKKRLKDFHREGDRCVSIYEQGKGQAEGATPDYNILYANTETIAPAVYSNLPRPLVKRRFSDPNKVADAGARVLKNTLSYLVKQEEDGYSCFDQLMRSTRTEALIAGWGNTSFEASGYASEERVEKEVTVCGSEVPWNRLLMGYGKVWAQVPWIAFEYFLTREELVETFGDTLGKQIPLDAAAREDDDKKDAAPADAQGTKFARIYKVWDKRDKKVKFISSAWPNIIKEVEDPLGLESFFPMPRPMQFIPSISSMVPRQLFLMYERQAKELNEVTRRISLITKALKVRGAYDSTISDIAEVLKADDNQLIAATGVVALQDGKGLESAIWLMPIDKLVGVLQQLYVNREACKKVIYEITGIADIMRGSSSASETLGAQQIKQQWGGMRLKTFRDEMSRYVVDSLKIMAEIACNKFSIDIFKQMTGILLPMKAERDQAIAALQHMQQQAQMAQQQAQQPPQPGMPPQPAPPPPDQNQMHGLQMVAESPCWEEVVDFLKNGLHRNYAIQIETNSTLAEELAEDREDLMQFMGALAQLVPALMGQVKEQILPFDTAKAILSAVCQKFRVGIDLEEQIAQMQAPPVAQPGMDPKAQAEVALVKQQMELEGQRGQQKLAQEKAHGEMEITLGQAKLAHEQEKMKFERERMGLEAERARQEHAIAMQGAQTDALVGGLTAHAAVTTAESKVATAAAKAREAEIARNTPAPAKKD